MPHVKPQRILVVVGLPGSGKTTATAFFQQKNVPVVRMGEVTEEMVRRLGREMIEENERFVREKLRKIYGSAVYAEMILPTLLRHVQRNDPLVAVESMHSPQEYQLLKTYFPCISLLSVTASDEARYARLSRRKIRPYRAADVFARDTYERRLGIEILQNDATFTVKNTGTRGAFRQELARVLKEVQNARC